MKNLFYPIAFFAFILAFSSCKKNDDLEVWREANTNAYNEIAKNPLYKALSTETGPTGVYYKVIKSGTGTEHPFQTSFVKVLYKGTYYDGSVFDAGTSGNDMPIEFDLTGQNIIRGFSFALQNMVIGDKWEIWIPYYLGYGAAGYTITDYYYYSTQTLIKGYTTLVFEIELVSITQYPK